MRFRKLSLSLGLTLVALGAAISGCAAPPEDDVAETEANLERKVTELPWGDARAAATPDGKLVVVSLTYGFLQRREVHVRRFLADGSADPTFTPPSPRTFVRLLDWDRGAELAAVTVSPNGSVVLALTYQNPLPPSARAYVALVRLAPDGSLDTSFGEGGVRLRDAQGRRFEGVAHWIASDAAGNVLTAGRTGSVLQLARHRASDGSLDPTFGQQGLVRLLGERLLDGSTDIFPLGFGAQPDGRIVVLSQVLSRLGKAEHYLLRLDANGNLDPTFGVGGRRRLTLSRREALTSLLVRADGRIVVGGAIAKDVSTPTARLHEADFRVRQFRANGTTDTRFGSSGQTTLAPDDVPSSCPRFDVTTLAEDSSGRLVGVGNWSTTNVAFRLLPDGAHDAAFGTSGFFELPGSRTSCSGTIPFATPVVFGNDVRFVAGSWPAQAIEIVSP